MDLRAYIHSTGRGEQKRLADAIGAFQSDVSSWGSGRRKPPIDKCAAIELATNGAVTRRDLRPDDWQLIWPELADSEPNTTPAPAQQAPAAINVEAVGEGTHG